MRLFEYGQLESRGLPVTTVSGVLRRRGTDAAARFSADSKSKVYGELREVTEKELTKLDKLEAPEYSRVRVTTDKGEKVYAYEDIQSKWGSFPIIESGKYNPKLTPKEEA